MFLAAIAQHALRDAERGADVGHWQAWFGREHFLEPGKNVSMMAAGRCLLRGPFRQTFDQRVEQLLLQPMRRLNVGQRSHARFRHPNRSPVEVAQLSCRRTRWLPARRGRNHEPGSTQYATVVGKLLFRGLNGSPVRGPDSSCVQPLG